MNAPVVLKAEIATHPAMKRLGMAEEMSSSRPARPSFVTGQSFSVDEGATAS